MNNNPPDNDEPFLSRWSRRKQAVAKGEAVPAVEGAEAALQGGTLQGEADVAAATKAQPAGDVAAEGEEKLDLETLPRVDELDEFSDIKAFLDKRVPAALRNAALGRMWTLDPTIRDFIEVAENQWNWNVPGGAPFYEPLEGGAEMAEEILSGFASGVKAVAEAVLPGDSAATLVGQEAAKLPVADAVGLIKDESAADVAAHSEAEAGAIVQSPPMPASVRQSRSEVTDTATQQSPHAGRGEDAPRRRHGGALPG